MSGGSYDYACFRVEEMALSLRNTDIDPRRAAFRDLLFLVQGAMHDIEWVDSCDLGPGDDHDSIDACFSFLKNSPEIIKKAAAYDSLKDHLLKYFNESK